MSNAIRIHRHALSGHSHRVELFVSLAGIVHELVDVDLLAGEHTKEPFLSLNPFGQVPVIEDGRVTLADANAILTYLAKKYAPTWLPEDAEEAGEVQRFLSLAAGQISYGPAAARLINVFGADRHAETAKATAAWAFQRLDAHLDGRDWLVGNNPTIADVAIYSYTAHAPEGGISLEPYPNIRSWLSRVQNLKGFVPMQASKASLAA
ncbi:glutathione S-transferase [Pelagibius sp. Alg239-R121]|uniref:glutathione S-transferase n=1 Tax=Pelagibius sp. Alg239-R121 TaxID=2993448 RepID=UPI0024A6AB0C|nr:glutathione S-transferase [Pelagibius sp. Alg239-R121]